MFASPPYWAVKIHVPATEKLPPSCACAVPFTRFPLGNMLQVGLLKTTTPVVVLEEVTVPVNVTVVPGVNLALEAEMVVVVTAGPPPPPPFPPLFAPPPHPSAKLSRHTLPKPIAARREGPRPGNKSSKIEASPAKAPSVHNASRPVGTNSGERRCAGAPCALRVVDGGRVAIVRVAVAAAPLLSVTEVGEMVHVAPGKTTPGPVWQLRATVLVYLVAGVIVSVVVPVWPAVMTNGAEPAETLKSGIVTVMKKPPPEAAS